MLDVRTEQISYLKDRVLYLEEKYNETLKENKKLKNELRYARSKTA